MKSNVKYDSDAKEEPPYGSQVEGTNEPNFNIITIADRKKAKDRILNNVDQMDVKLVFTLYQQLAHVIKESLQKQGLIPDEITLE